MTVRKIISGGQTGADRGGLDAALALGIPHGGWCPQNRRAEDGRVPMRYSLVETDSVSYVDRTSLNIVHSDATIVFAHDITLLEPGSRLTRDLASRSRKPHIVLDAFKSSPEVVTKWLSKVKPTVLNVAGNRESVAPGIQVAVRELLVAALGRSRRVVTRVINRKGSRRDFDVYVGRPSIWGNPFSTKTSSVADVVVDSLDTALRGYEKHLAANPILIARARKELRGKTLSCWCTDDLDGTGEIMCHAQILARVADGADLPVMPESRGLGRLAAALKDMGGG